MATTNDIRTTGTTGRSDRSPLYSSLIGLAALGVVLQGLWAGIFIREGKDVRESWVTVHAIGADITIALAVIATVVAFVQLRHRREIVVGSIVFTVLLALEAFIGGLVGGHQNLQAVHFPLALALVGLAVWLPLRASQRA
jgi:heme A synthase